MDKGINYAFLLNALWKNDTEVINYIYDAIVKDEITDRKVLIRLMAYMYSVMDEEKYINLIRLLNRVSENDSEIAYFISFYFLIKNSPYHAFLAFTLVSENESPYYHALSVRNRAFLERTNSKITYMMRKSLESALLRDPENDSLKEQLSNLDSIENDIKNTVLKVIEMTKKDNLTGKNFNLL